MAESKYCVIFRGEILEYYEVDEVKENLASLIKTDKNKIDSLFSGERVVVKKDASLELCEKTRVAFEKAGAKCFIMPQEVFDEDSHDKKEPEPEREQKPLEKAVEKSVKKPYAPKTVEETPEQRLHTESPRTKSEPEKKIGKARKVVNKPILLVLTFFLGGLGVHKFYLGRYPQGMLYFMFSWTFIPFLIALSDFIYYARNSEKKLAARYKEVGSLASVILVSIAGPIIFAGFIVIIASIIYSRHTGYKETYITAKTSSPDKTVRKGKKHIKAEKPRGNITGRIHGMDFTFHNARVRNEYLTIRQGMGFFSDLEIMIVLPSIKESIDNRKINITPESSGPDKPIIYMRWLNKDTMILESMKFTSGYFLKLEFGQVKDGKVLANINIKLPDEMKSYMKGKFEAKVRKQK